MAGFAQMEDYAFEKFESRPGRVGSYGAQGNTAPRRNTAPQRRSEERETPVLKKVDPKTMAQKRSEERSGNVRIAFMLAFVAVVFGVICCQISACAERYELTRKIAEVEADIEVAKSENVRLNAELNSKTNIMKIDSYAVDVLGMVKVESYQVECIALTKGDCVRYCSNTK